MNNSVSAVPMLFFEFDRPRGMMSSVLDRLPTFMRSRLNVNGDTMRADLETLKTLVNDPQVKDYNVIKMLKWELCHRYPDFMGPCDLDLSAEFLEKYRSMFTVLEIHRPAIDPPLEDGYHRLACPEPLILEPEDWARSEWGTLCKLCGMDPGNTSRIVINVKSIEAFIEPDFDKKDVGKNILIPETGGGQA